MEGIKKLVFFFPWTELSGGPNYLSKLANEVAEQTDYDVYYIDHPHGASEGKVGELVKKIIYAEPFSLPISEPVILVTPIYCAPHIPNMDPQSRIIFLNWHNYCIPQLCGTWRLADKQLQQFLALVHKSRAVFFLDKTHWLAQDRCVRPYGAYHFEETYVPPTISEVSLRCKRECISDKRINIAVLGRLCKDKIFSVLNLVYGLMQLEDPRPIHLTIIGDGEEAWRLQEIATGEKVKIHQVGVISGEALRLFLAKNIDILFGMGLSILEGARIGMPSVIIPHNIHAFEKDAYTYLQDSTGYALGWYDTQIDELGPATIPLRQIIDDIYQRGKKDELGTAAMHYVKEKHQENVPQFLQVLEKGTLTYSNFVRFAKKQGKIRIFGIPIATVHSSFDGMVRSVSVPGVKDLLTLDVREDWKLLIKGKEQSTLIAHKVQGKYRLFVKLPIFKA